MLKNKESGQVLLIVILVMVVALTVGLSVVSKSVTDLRTSKEEASSQKALAAAEAGIEQLLQLGIGTIPAGTSFPGDPSTTYGATVDPISGTEFLLNGGNVVPQDDGADVWFVNHIGNKPDYSTFQWSGSLTIYWGDSSGICTDVNAALEIAVLTDSDPSPAVVPVLTRYAYDPCPRSNNFSSPSLLSHTFGGKTFSYSTTITVGNGLIARVVPLYKSIPIDVSGSVALPSQGIVVDSIGKSLGTERKIKVFKGYPQLPVQYFLYGLFSP